MKLSIITTCLNSQNSILYTLNSIMSQSYKNIEHIIVDGGSTDNTVNIIKNYPFNNKKIILKKNVGIYEGINLGLKSCTGDIISILNSDDIYQSKDTIKKIIPLIEKDKKNKIFLGDVVYFKDKNFSKINRYYPSRNFIRDNMFFGNMPPHPASFIKKEVYQKYGLYNKKFKIAGDFDLFLRTIFINKVPFKIIKQVIVRMKSGGISGRNIKSYFITTREIVTAFKINNLKNNMLRVLIRIPSKLSQYWNINSKILNLGFKNPKIKYGFNFIDNYFQLIKNEKYIPFKKNFILSGMNLAFLGYYIKKETQSHPDQYHWPDGIFSKYLSIKIKKIPGRQLLARIKIPKNIEQIEVLGNCTERNIIYLKNKFKLPIKITPLIYGSIEKIIKKKIVLKKNSLTFITLPTPKQEILAYELAKYNKQFKIICIGASISLASKEETPVPSWMANYEFLWRLQSDTFRRIKRLFESMFYLLIGLLIDKRLKDIHMQVIDE